jgi:monoterpene epsilon-lactone hydrolase
VSPELSGKAISLQDGIVSDFPIPQHASIVPATGLAGLEITTNASDPGRVVLYFPDGAPLAGGHDNFHKWAARLAATTRSRIIVPEWPRLPGMRFPDAVDVATAAYRAVLNSGIPAGRLALGGDSAGGGLVLAILLAIKGKVLPLPAAAFVVSPWVDLTLSGDSMETREARDPFFTRSELGKRVACLVGDGDAGDPRVSPLFGDLSGLPPLLIEVGSEEVLFDDAARLHDLAGRAGVSATLEVTENAPHIWRNLTAFPPESRATTERIGDHIRRYTPRLKVRARSH